MHRAGVVPDGSKRPDLSGLDGGFNCCFGSRVADLVFRSGHLVVLAEPSVSFFKFQIATITRLAATFSHCSRDAR